MKKIFYIIAAVFLLLQAPSAFADTYTIGKADYNKPYSGCWGEYSGPEGLPMSYIRWFDTGTKDFVYESVAKRIYATDPGAQSLGVGTYLNCIPLDHFSVGQIVVGVMTSGVSMTHGRFIWDDIDHCTDGDDYDSCVTKVMAAQSPTLPYPGDSAYSADQLFKMHFIGQYKIVSGTTGTATLDTASSSLAMNNGELTAALGQLFYKTTANDPATDLRLLGPTSLQTAPMTFMVKQILVVIGSGLLLLVGLWPYILALIAIGVIVWFTFRAFRFMRH